MKIYKSLLFLIFIAGSFSLSGQTTADSSIVQRLERATPRSGTVHIIQPTRLTERMGRAGVIMGADNGSAAVNYMVVSGYRIQVFSDNNQRQSKEEAQSKERLIKNNDSELETYITFTSPFWRLRVGNFRNYEDANQKMQELKIAFPQFSRDMRIVRDEIRIAIHDASYND